MVWYKSIQFIHAHCLLYRLFFNVIAMHNAPNLTPDFDLNALRASAAQATTLLKALSNPDRLLLLCQLVEGERCVSELEAQTGIAQPTLSQQLGVLREEGLVNTRREGRQIFYTVASTAALALIEVLYQQFCAPKN
ncbi:Biofilm growth-associated repressor [Ephemeroptericola cinctiostellae]|uniref:Biofilm growth-associated repressor n=2 Tax=Ephemeroptericola cinctiostellae TaxID=2268024 RepID=A0A345DAT8_9BURK|nr:Biofilm growth-associated repressor [Ephemeroptericola cinctiostellae]